MTIAVELVRHVQSLGARLWVEEEQLQLDAPSDFPDDLIDLLRQHKADILEILPGITGDSVSEQHRRPLADGGQVAKSESGQLPLQALINGVAQWAGDDPKQWGMVVKKLSRRWEPATWYVNTSRDVLVAWASVNERRSEANVALTRMKGIRQPSKRESAARAAHRADVSFYGRLSEGFRTRAAAALQQDNEAHLLLTKMGTKVEGHSSS